MELVDALEVEDPELNAPAPQVLRTHTPSAEAPALRTPVQPSCVLVGGGRRCQGVLHRVCAGQQPSL